MQYRHRGTQCNSPHPPGIQLPLPKGAAVPQMCWTPRDIPNDTGHLCVRLNVKSCEKIPALVKLGQETDVFNPFLRLVIWPCQTAEEQLRTVENFSDCTQMGGLSKREDGCVSSGGRDNSRCWLALWHSLLLKCTIVRRTRRNLWQQIMLLIRRLVGLKDCHEQMNNSLNELLVSIATHW